MGKFILTPWVSSMSWTQPVCDFTSSTLTAITLTLRLSNSGLSLATAPSSVVQTGVKSLGWENRTAHLSPIQSWNLMVPSVDSWVKSGALEPSVMLMSASLGQPEPLAVARTRARDCGMAAAWSGLDSPGLGPLYRRFGASATWPVDPPSV